MRHWSRIVMWRQWLDEVKSSITKLALVAAFAILSDVSFRAIRYSGIPDSGPVALWIYPGFAVWWNQTYSYVTVKSSIVVISAFLLFANGLLVGFAYPRPRAVSIGVVMFTLVCVIAWLKSPVAITDEGRIELAPYRSIVISVALYVSGIVSGLIGWHMSIGDG